MPEHLVVPALFDPPGGADTSIPRLPNLELLLARGTRQAAPVGYVRTLFELFAVPLAPGSDPPSAVVEWLAETGRAPEGSLLHATPVYLRPDQDRLLAFPLAPEQLGGDEVQAVVQAFNRHFAEQGLRLETAPSRRWFLFAEETVAASMTPPAEVAGRNVDPFLPRGDQAGLWRQRLNETQMLCHGLTLNAAREAEGKPPISGIWFSGGGALPLSAAPERSFRLMPGSGWLAQGLQMLAAREYDGPVDVALQVENSLLDAVSRVDADAWLASLARVDEQLAARLSTGQSLVLHTCDGRRWSWRRSMRHRVWRRRVPLGNYRVLENRP